jgi:hypothetical protein
MESSCRHRSVLVLLFAAAFLGTLLGPRAATAAQTVEELCPRSPSASSEGGISYDDFKARFGGRFKSEHEALFAWRVYRAVHDTPAIVVLGRLTDTKQYLGKPGYCVLSNLDPYTTAINEAFLFGGTDRNARFLLVSESPREIMGDVSLSQAETDREKYWRVIYSHELDVLHRTGKYRIPVDLRPPHTVVSSARSVMAAGSGAATAAPKPGNREATQFTFAVAGHAVVVDIKSRSQKPNPEQAALHLQSGETFSGFVTVNGRLRPGEAIYVHHPQVNNILVKTATSASFSGVTQPKGFGAATTAAAYLCITFPTGPCRAQADINIYWKP